MELEGLPNVTSTKREQGEEFKIQLLALDLALEMLKKNVT